PSSSRLPASPPPPQPGRRNRRTQTSPTPPGPGARTPRAIPPTLAAARRERERTPPTSSRPRRRPLEDDAEYVPSDDGEGDEHARAGASKRARRSATSREDRPAPLSVANALQLEGLRTSAPRRWASLA